MFEEHADFNFPDLCANFNFPGSFTKAQFLFAALCLALAGPGMDLDFFSASLCNLSPPNPTRTPPGCFWRANPDSTENQ